MGRSATITLLILVGLTWLIPAGFSADPNMAGIRETLTHWHSAVPMVTAEMTRLRAQAQLHAYRVDNREGTDTLAVAQCFRSASDSAGVQADLLDALKRTSAGSIPETVGFEDLRYLPLDDGYVLALPSQEPKLVFLPRASNEVYTICPDVAASSVCLSGGRIVVTEGVVTVRGEERGGILVFDPMQHPPVLQERYHVPYAIMAASYAADGSIVALATNSILRVDSAGQFQIVYGAVGVPIARDARWLSWRASRPNSIVQVGSDFAIGADFGVIWLSWNPDLRAFEEYWLFPPGLSHFLLEAKGVHRLTVSEPSAEP